jgi:thermostable 8-oxoguanine DNA glycosylase
MSFLVDPSDVIKYDRTDAELELFWLFCAVVAGKTATTQARLLNNFIESLDRDTAFNHDSPMQRIYYAQRKGVLFDKIKESRLGQYNRLSRFFMDSVALRLRTCTLEELEAVRGCGPKTARMFLMMSRPKQRYAALDTHVLKHLRANGIEAPKATPSAGPTYRRLEEEFLKLADAAGMEVSDYDLMVWKKYSGANEETVLAA